MSSSGILKFGLVLLFIVSTNNRIEAASLEDPCKEGLWRCRNLFGLCVDCPTSLDSCANEMEDDEKRCRKSCAGSSGLDMTANPQPKPALNPTTNTSKHQNVKQNGESRNLSQKVKNERPRDSVALLAIVCSLAALVVFVAIAVIVAIIVLRHRPDSASSDHYSAVSYNNSSSGDPEISSVASNEIAASETMSCLEYRELPAVHV